MESTLNKALSGAEIREAILFDVKKALENDDHLAAHIAYDGFAYKVKLDVSLPSAIQQEFTRELSGEKGKLEGVLGVDEIETERPLQPPNEVRYDTEQPIPILTTDNEGHTVEKMVSYVGKDRSGRPKGQKPSPNSPPASVEKVKRNIVRGIDQ